MVLTIPSRRDCVQVCGFGSARPGGWLKNRVPEVTPTGNSKAEVQATLHRRGLLKSEKEMTNLQRACFFNGTISCLCRFLFQRSAAKPCCDIFKGCALQTRKRTLLPERSPKGWRRDRTHDNGSPESLLSPTVWSRPMRNCCTTAGAYEKLAGGGSVYSAFLH